MWLQEIVKENEDYKKLKEECNKKYAKLKLINNGINLEEVKQLTYQQIKSLYELTKYCIEDDSIQNGLKEIYKEAKIKEYPILGKAHHYPILNELDFLTDKQKNEIDETLVRFYGGDIITNCSAWRDLKLTKEQTEKVLEFLYNKGLATRTYRILCECGCSKKYITEEQYNKFVAYHSVKPEEYEKHESKWKEDGYFYIGCWNDGDREICSIEDLKRYAKPYCYELNAEPDSTYEEL